jgi:hypothetical protein
MQRALYTVETWCDEVGLSVNPDKNLTPFYKEKESFGLFEPHLLGVALHHAVSVKYLGVIPDSWLAWRDYVDVRLKGAHNLLWACGVMWGLSGWTREHPLLQ